MKQILFALTISALALGSFSCVTTMPIQATSAEIGTKMGIAERKIFLGIAFGHTDLGAYKAAKAGGIDKIATVDMRAKGGLFSTTYQTIVTGN